jgi:ABC-type lipoprotein export system ATPase subunit
VILELSNIQKTYQSPTGTDPVTVLKEISLQISKGESVAIVGPSGSGKSTILNIMGTLDKPTAGTVTIGGQNIVSVDDQELAYLRNQKIGFIFQLHHLLPQCTVLENVLLPSLTLKKNIERKEVEERAKRLLDRVGLKQHLYHRPSQLSGGEQQRVAVVRALINQPEIILADEPTGSLDQNSAKKLGNLLVELNKEEGVTLVLVTHSIELAKQMNRVLRLSDGYLEELEKE